MEGRLRTASNPSNTCMLSAEYVDWVLFSSLIIVYRSEFGAQKYEKTAINEIGWPCWKSDIFS